jgi:cobalt/nickel transport system permease protein
MMAIIALSATTRLSDLLLAFSNLRLPNILVMQIGLLYRYIFLIIDRACHMLRARGGRKLRYLGLRRELSTSAAMIASLFATSTQTAQRVSDAMMARGFDGTTRSLKKSAFSISDTVFLAAVCAYMALLLAVKGVI